MKNLAEVAENFLSKITQLHDPNKAVHGVILDCDWFVLGAKQNAFFRSHFGMFFQFPKRSHRVARYFDHQSRSFAHHLRE